MTIDEGQEGARGSETRARILRAAMDLFAREGFDRTGVRAIAERCGLTDAALYYHFRSKRAILQALLSNPLGSALRELPVRPVCDGAALGKVIDSMLDGMATFDSVSRVLVKQALLDDQTALALRNDSIAQWRRRLLPHFEASFAKEGAALRTDALMMLLLGVLYSGQMDFGPAFPKKLHEPQFRAWVHEMARACIPLEAAAV